MHHHTANGRTTIAYEVDGPADAPALLFINSIGTTHELWGRQVRAFSGDFRVIRYDARGHGRSAVPQGDYSIDQLGLDALAVLDAVGVASAHVCGISLGGLTGLWLGINAADRVRTLVAANTAARIGSVESWTERMQVVRDRGMSAVADLAMARWFTPDFHERDRDTVHGFRAMVQACPAEGYLGCCAAMRDADLREQVSAIRVPTLAIASSADTATPPEGLEFLRDRIPGARLVTLDSAHLSNVECAEEFDEAVLEFLPVSR